MRAAVEFVVVHRFFRGRLFGSDVVSLEAFESMTERFGAKAGWTVVGLPLEVSTEFPGDAFSERGRPLGVELSCRGVCVAEKNLCRFDTHFSTDDGSDRVT